MEELPFDDAVFELVTRQFGIEYGDVAKIAPEVARVLGRKGCFHFIVHHAEGPIVAHNVGRLAGLRWAASESKLLDKARAVVRARSNIALPTPDYFRAAPAEGRARFPGQGVAEEFAAAVLQTLELGRSWPPRESLEVLDTLEAKADNEIGRIEALCGAALAPGDMDRFLDRLRTAGLSPDEPDLLFEEGSEIPFAWHIKGRRAEV